MASTRKDGLDETKRLMGALLRMKPKPHEEMKVGKKSKKKSGRKRRTSDQEAK